jgi:hypothetical protein
MQLLGAPASAELMSLALAVLLAMLPSAHTRTHVRVWQHVSVLCTALFHPALSVRYEAALCICHLALAPERLKAVAFRNPHLVARELDGPVARELDGPDDAGEIGGVCVCVCVCKYTLYIYT